MLLDAAFSDARRAISAPVVEFETFRGSVGPWPSVGDLGALNGWVISGSEVAAPGATGRTGVCCEMFAGVRACMGMFVVLGVGAGRV